VRFGSGLGPHDDVAIAQRPGSTTRAIGAWVFGGLGEAVHSLRETKTKTRGKNQMEDLKLTEMKRISPLERPPELLQALLTIAAIMTMAFLMIAIAQPHWYCYAQDPIAVDQIAR